MSQFDVHVSNFQLYPDSWWKSAATIIVQLLKWHDFLKRFKHPDWKIRLLFCLEFKSGEGVFWAVASSSKKLELYARAQINVAFSEHALAVRYVRVGEDEDNDGKKYTTIREWLERPCLVPCGTLVQCCLFQIITTVLISIEKRKRNESLSYGSWINRCFSKLACCDSKNSCKEAWERKIWRQENYWYILRRKIVQYGREFEQRVRPTGQSQRDEWLQIEQWFQSSISTGRQV